VSPGRPGSPAGRPGAHPSDAEVLTCGEVEVEGRFAGSSNATLLVTCSLGGRRLPAVYKPERGERPLWDFPSGLWRRELGAYLLSEALGWGIVPVTVARAEAPFGPGSLQRLVDDDGESHYFTLAEEARFHPVLKMVAAFDVVANNADRKSGHVLLAEGRLWAIDHGLCFHRQAKLRTVIWDFAGEPVPDDLAADLEGLAREGLPDSFGRLLSGPERAAVVERARRLLASGAFPEPVSRGEWPPYPWPLV
jgi:uncharacterized repeat protein (TIGR03843 family)